MEIFDTIINFIIDKPLQSLVILFVISMALSFVTVSFRFRR